MHRKHSQLKDPNRKDALYNQITYYDNDLNKIIQSQSVLVEKNITQTRGKKFLVF